MITATISKSPNPKKKYKVVVTDGTRKKTIHFGANGMSDFLHHKDKDRKQRYISRHQKRENWDDPFTAGFWALHVLWNKPTLTGSLRNIRDEYDIKIKNDI